MKKLLLSLKTSLAIFWLSLALSTHSVHAEDIEIYGIADANNPPVNVLFVFDLSNSMGLVADGSHQASSGETSRRDILLTALTNVLDQNKDNANLRVGISWFNHYDTGIRWPVTSILSDAHDTDPDIPAGTFQTYEIIPHLLKTDGSLYGKTKMVPALLEAAYYFRGEEVWRGARTPEAWNVGENKYKGGNDWSAFKQTYTATNFDYPPYNGTHAYTKQYKIKTKTNQRCWPSQSWCHDGYDNGSSRMNVRNCWFEEVWTDNWSCPDGHWVDGYYSDAPVNEQWVSGYCDVPKVNNPTVERKDYCTYDYWQSKWLGAKYNTPITTNCTPSFIILLSDGEPTRNGAEYRIKKLTGTDCADVPGLPYGKCGPELIEYLANNDQINGLPGTTVSTYTIGFGVDGVGKDYLELLAEKGNGVFYPASNATDLEEAFNLIIDSITGDNETFTGLVTTIRASTLSSDNRVFMNMFKPGDTRSWKGNTKGYFISPEGLKDTNGAEAVAIIDDAERFKDSAQSFWSNNPDGNFVELGGASGELNAGSRNIYTYVDAAAPSNSSLTLMTTSETLITPALLGVADDTEKDALIDWLYNSKMADPLHAKPVLISYSDKDVLYSMTNQGLLHAIDTTHPTGFNDHDGGNELFAFIPQALLPQLKDHKANLNSSGHLYGLDGPISHYHADTNKDQIVNNGEKVYLYFGMRRGGNHYYALDVSDPSAPKLAWRIDGGAGDFTELGQTWSRMIPTTVKWSGGVKKKVLIFGGGYDTDQDDHDKRTADDVGNAVFMVDAFTGTLLWKATKNNPSNKMKYSIPADITVIDSDDDQIADRLYFGDMGGQIWRFDLDQAGNGANITGFRLADLAKNGDTEDNRRFYSPPSVAKIRGDSGFYYAVAIGSGFRAHPLESKIEDYFYMIRDTNVEVGAPSSSWSIVKEGDLYDITANVIGEGSGGSASDIAAAKAAAKIALENEKGWKLKLDEDNGEKNLSPSLIFDFKLAFTTFSPNSGGNSVCGGSGGKGRFYLINLEDGTPVRNFYDDTTPPNYLTAQNRYKTVPGMGIPTEPVPYFPPGIGKVDLYVGKHKGATVDNPMVKINWKILK